MSDSLDERSTAIRSLQDKELRLKTQVKALKKRLAEERRTVQIAIESEWTTSKAPSLSNATKRRIALDQRIEEDRDYSLMTTEIESLELRLEDLGHDIEEELRAFRNDHARIIIRSQHAGVLPAFVLSDYPTGEEPEKPEETAGGRS